MRRSQETPADFIVISHIIFSFIQLLSMTFWHTEPEVSHEVLQYYIYTYTWFGPLRTFPTLFIPLDSRKIHVWFNLQKSWAFIYIQGQPRCLLHRAYRINGDQRCSETREHLDQRRLEDTCLSDSAKTHTVLSLWQTCPYHSYAVRVKHSVPHSLSWVFLHAASHAAGLFPGHSFVFSISQGFTFIKKN